VDTTAGALTHAAPQALQRATVLTGEPHRVQNQAKLVPLAAVRCCTAVALCPCSTVSTAPDVHWQCHMTAGYVHSPQLRSNQQLVPPQGLGQACISFTDIADRQFTTLFFVCWCCVQVHCSPCPRPCPLHPSSYWDLLHGTWLLLQLICDTHNSHLQRHSSRLCAQVSGLLQQHRGKPAKHLQLPIHLQVRAEGSC